MELENVELIQVAQNIADEKGLEKDLVFEAIESAISKAGKTKYGNNYDIRAIIDRDTGKISLARYLEVKKIVDAGYQRAKKILTEKLNDLHKLAKALLVYETLSGEEIKDLILKNIEPKRVADDPNNKEESSALGSLGLKPKPAH